MKKALLLGFVPLLFWSCGTGNLSVSLTDAPADDYSNVIVNIKEVQLIQAGQENGDSSGGVVKIATFTNGQQKTDLLKLQNVTTLLGSSSVNAGTYPQIRLLLFDSGNTATSKTGDTRNLEVASGTTTGVKVVIPGGLVITKDATTAITLDWDLNTSGGSQIIAKDSQTYLMTPVIKVAKQTQTPKGGNPNAP